MTYPSDDEKTTQLPGWMRLMRFLVIALLCVSILAMASLIFAAFKIVGKSINQTPNFDEISFTLPEGATPLSLTILPDDKKIIIYQDNSGYFGQIIPSSDGAQQDITIR